MLKRLSIILTFILIVVSLTQGCSGEQEKAREGESHRFHGHSDLLPKQEVVWEGEIARFQGESDDKSQEGGQKAGTVYLTFDDGPSENTEHILRILADHKVRATFFVNGKETDYAAKMYQRIVAEGHALGNHTYTHKYDQIYSSTDALLKDIEELDELLKDVTGKGTRYFRFPGGSNSSFADRQILHEARAKLAENNYLFFDWDVDSTDSAQKQQPAHIIIKETLSQIKGKEKAIVLFHDGPNKQSTVEALPTILTQLEEWGYEFRTLSSTSPKRQFRL